MALTTTTAPKSYAPRGKGAKKGVQFNKDDTVTVTDEDSTRTISREDYKNEQQNTNVALGDSGKAGSGLYSGSEGEIIQKQRDRQDVDVALAKTRTEAIKQNIINKYWENVARERGLLDEQGNAVIPGQQQIPGTEQVQTLNEPQQVNGDFVDKAGRKVYSPGSIPNKIASAFGNETPQAKINFNTAFETIATPIGKIYDFVESAFHGGKGIEQREAESTYAQIEGDLATDISLVQQGLKDPNVVKENIKKARTANNRLLNSITGFNKINLRYAVLHGVDVKERVMNNNDNLGDYEARLLAAELNYNDIKRLEAINNARLLYGAG